MLYARQKLCVLFIFLCATITWAQSPQEVYVLQYKELAIIEMHRGGVPASITLAQGILESNCGRSSLATQGNNHFGIKCHNGWEGRTMYVDDDEKGECFRVYETALESFQDHTDFLRTRSRYAELFLLARSDYKGWCHGLKKAGYATNPRYAIILIDLIERYKLYEYDNDPLGGDILVENSKEFDPGNPKVSGLTKSIFEFNRIKTVYLLPGESIKDVESRSGIDIRLIRKYNELEAGTPKPGEHIFLQPKRRNGSKKIHVVEPGDTYYSISQLYGIKLKHLYRKNLAVEGTQPATGEKVFLQEKRKVPIRVRTENEPKPQPTIKPAAKNNTEKVTPTIVNNDIKSTSETPVKAGDNPKPTVTTPAKNSKPEEKAEVFEPRHVFNPTIATDSATADEEIQAVLTDELPVPDPILQESMVYQYHIVQAGETLYGLSRRFNCSVDQLIEWNNLSDNNLSVGQRLIVGREG